MGSTVQAEALKVLAVGAPLSDLALMSRKITTINAKHGPFDACVVVGDLFKEGSDGSELDGLSLPVPTYFSVGKNALPASVEERVGASPEVASNLVYLGKSSVFTTAQGLKIAVAGGGYDAATYDSEEENQSAYAPVMSKSSIASLLSQPAMNVDAEEEATSLQAAKGGVLPSAFHGIDILLTFAAPPSLGMLSPSYPSSGVALATPAPPLAEVVKRARPRYMFWADGAGFWEREPFGWSGPGGKEERWTRSVKIAALGAPAGANGKAPRSVYATSLPAQSPTAALPARPANATPNPFSISGAAGKKRATEDDGDAESRKKGKTEHGPPPDHYTCKICQVPGHWIQDCPQKADRSKPPPDYQCNICKASDHFIRDCPQRETARVPSADYTCRACGKTAAHYIRDCPVVKERDQERSKRKELGPAECWFCLSNPKVTKHLIVAIGSETYVTLPKGQLIPTRGGDKPLVPGGGHVLIIPIAHHPTLLSIPPADAMNIISELEAYKSSLRACFAQYDAVPVTFEVGRLGGRGGHAHVQVVPIPAALADKVADGFTKAGEAAGLDWEAEPERALSRVGASGNYFKVECPDGQRLVHLLKGNFDLQFGRTVLSGLLGLHHRVNWKDCVQTDAEDKEDAQKFKKALAPFLPS